jgi:hypothetical protein
LPENALSAREHRFQIPKTLAAVRLLARRVVSRHRCASPPQVILRKLGEEARRLTFASLACAFAPAAERQMEASLRARHADVEKPSFFLDIAVCDRLAMRQEAFLETDQEHMRKFEAFCGVQRRQADGVGLAALLPV